MTIRELTDAELDGVAGAGDKNYKYCAVGTTAGGGAGLYPNSTECAVTLTDVINSFMNAYHKASTQKPQ